MNPVESPDSGGVLEGPSEADEPETPKSNPDSAGNAPALGRTAAGSGEGPEAAAEEAGGAPVPEQLAFDSAVNEPPPGEEARLKAVIEAIIYVAEEPVTAAQIAAVLQQPEERVREALAQLTADYAEPGRGLLIREVAGGYKMATRPEHHEALRTFARSLKPPLKLSLAALETLAVIAYKQPITAPEVQEIRGVQGAGVLKTLLDRKLITTAGRKAVIGKPILYKTTKEFLLQFGLKDLSELPTLKEFEELRRLAFSDTETEPPAADSPGPLAEPAAAAEPTGPEPEPQAADSTAPQAEPAAAAEPTGPEPEPQAAESPAPSAEPAATPEPTKRDPSENG